MQAIITLNVLCRVEDEETASRYALEAEKNARLGIVSALERSEDYVNSDLTFDDIENVVRVLGVSVMVLPEVVV